MQSLHDIRRRIRSISSTAQITKAMQMVAASKMRKIQQAAVDGHPFVQLLYRMERAAATHLGEFTHPLLEVREVHKRAVILIGTDKGLCGALNTNLFRLAAEFDPATTVFITGGRKAAQFVARSKRQLLAEFGYADMPRFPEARAIAAFACDLFLKKEVDQVFVVATRFVNTMTQQPLSLEYLPVGEIKGLQIPGVEFKDELTGDTAEVLFEPSPQALLNYLISNAVNIYIYQVLLEAKASEQSARMVSMKSATDNAEGLIRHLTLEYNRLRQDNITQEMLEIAGGQAS